MKKVILIQLVLLTFACQQVSENNENRDASKETELAAKAFEDREVINRIFLKWNGATFEEKIARIE